MWRGLGGWFVGGKGEEVLRERFICRCRRGGC